MVTQQLGNPGDVCDRVSGLPYALEEATAVVSLVAVVDCSDGDGGVGVGGCQPRDVISASISSLNTVNNRRV